MKRYGQSLALILGVIGGASAASAGDVAGLTTFTPGTAARAAEVNANFNAVKSAVDDNNGRIGAIEGQNLDARLGNVETGKQDRVTGTCAAGSSIRAVNLNGSVVCGPDDSAALAAEPPLSINGNVIGLSNNGISNGHISPTAAIAASKISGDAGIEYNNTFWSNNNIPTTITSLGSIVVSAPGPGSILLLLNGTATSSGVNFLYAFGIGITADTFAFSRSVTPSTNSQPFSINWVFPVSAAGDYTFHALASKVDPTACCTARALDVNLVALYVPKRY